MPLSFLFYNKINRKFRQLEPNSLSFPFLVDRNEQNNVFAGEISDLVPRRCNSFISFEILDILKQRTTKG